MLPTTNCQLPTKLLFAALFLFAFFALVLAAFLAFLALVFAAVAIISLEFIDRDKR